MSNTSMDGNEPRIRTSTLATAVAAAFGTCLFAVSASAQDFSFDAAKAAAAKGDRPRLIRYAEGVRDGWVFGVTFADIEQLVDARAPKADLENEMLARHIKCVRALRLEDIVTKTLAMDESQLQLKEPIERFSMALAFTIDKLCPVPALEIKAEHPLQ